MQLQSVMTVLLGIGLEACGHHVTVVTPILRHASLDDSGQVYVRELAHLPIASGLERDHLVSPDRHLKLALTHDNGLLGMPNGFYGVTLVDAASGQGRPILSLWEADAGSGIDLNVRWSADSRAVRLVGRTQGFRRYGGEFREFDILYLVNDDRYLNLCKCS